MSAKKRAPKKRQPSVWVVEGWEGGFGKDRRWVPLVGGVCPVGYTRNDARAKALELFAASPVKTRVAEYRRVEKPR